MNWPWRKREPLVEAYRLACRRQPRLDLPLRDQSLIVLDAETSGFRLDADRMLSLAVIRIEHGEVAIGSLRQWLVYQSQAVFNAAVEVHGILPSDTAVGQAEGDVIRQLLPLIAGKLIIGHHISFDMAILDRAARRHCNVRLRNRVLDTAALAMRELVAFHKTGYVDQRPPTLEEVCDHLGINPMERHTAAGDAFTTAEIFLLLVARLRRRLGRAPGLRDLPVGRR